MRIKYKNEEPSQIRQGDDCSKLKDKDRLKMDDSVVRFINVLTKNENEHDIREGVVGVVAPWGSGKSFFLNLLFCRLKRNFSVVYMDASHL